MRRHSIIWFIVVMLKIAAILSIVDAIYQSINTEFRWYTTVHASLRLIITPVITAVLLWGAAEGLRMIANTEAYSRGVYSALRNKPQQKNKSKQAASHSASRLLQEREQRYAEVAADAQKPKPGMSSSSVSFDSLEPVTSSNLRYSPPDRVRQQRGQQRAPARRVTVFRDRAEHQERPARPSGTIEVVDSLDGGSVNNMRTQGIKPINDALPFDEVS